MKRFLLIVLTLAFMLTVSSGCATSTSTSGVSATQQIAPQEETATALGPTPIPTETPAPTATPVPAPATVSATVLTNGYPVQYGELKRGETVSIVGEEGEYYKISYGTNFRGEAGPVMLVEKRFIQTDGATTEPYTVYAGESAVLYDTALLTREVSRPARNTELSVLDALEGILYVSYTGTDGATAYGYIASSDVTDTAYVAPTYTASTYSDSSYSTSSYSEPSYSTQEYNGPSTSVSSGDTVIGGGSGSSGSSDWSSSSGGSSSSSSSSSGGTSYGYDGGDISAGSLLDARVIANSLTALFRVFSVSAYADDAALPASGVCFSDGVPVYISVLAYGDSVAVLADTDAEAGTVSATNYALASSGALETEETEVEAVSLLVQDCVVEVPAYTVRLDSEPASEWTGYVQPDVTGHKMADLSDDGVALALNTEVKTTELGNGIYLILVPSSTGAQAEFYYVAPGGVSASEYEVAVYTPDVSYSSYSYSSGSDSSYSGSSTTDYSYTGPASSSSVSSSDTTVIGGGGGSSGSSDWSSSSGGSTGSSETVSSWTEPTF